MPRHANHDRGYKLLFSHPELVADLLQGFVHEPWVARLDFATLERVPDRFVTEHLQEREDDVIWRVRWADEARWVYIYLLLEFQSRNDSYMALRLLTYVSLLYQELLRNGGSADGERLPPVLPLVLYNGERPWRATRQVGRLIASVPGGLERYRPRFSYLLLDEWALEEQALPQARNLAAALFCLERSRTIEELQVHLGTLAEWLVAPEQTNLRRAFTVWIKRVLLPHRVPGATIPEVHDLQEVKSMLSERTVDWTRSWKEMGIEEGRKEGRKEGEATVLLRQLDRKFGADAADHYRGRIDAADAETLLVWSERILTAETADAVFAESAGG